jgi:imidazolonepropionase-like amidohydrolase
LLHEFMQEIGTVEAGKRGDLVVVDGDPLADIRATRAVRVVVAAGRAYHPGALWSFSGFAP